ncbi:glycine cleavage system protein R [Glaciecola sp. MF2-115]|uniref:glycine cleavage system protein R n=1 Tax=Glaciecola sp. MF2-115 TaxID=3384827 RepID=UPI0039A1FC67
MQAMVLTLIGKDKPGLVDEIAKCIIDSEGNWLKSSFCQLSGQFAGFIEVMIPQEKQNDLVHACHQLAHLHITLVPSHAHEQSLNAKAIIQVTGNDRRGIVSDITSVLKTFDINITEMTTNCESAPNWGSPLFTAKVTISVAKSMDLDKVKLAIEDITDDLMVEIEKS